MPKNFKSLLVGKSASIQRLREMVDKAAKLDIPVLITGETGTGKDLVAAEIHAKSDRRDKPFVAVNMGTLSRELVASELFGHVQGAFTGADHAQDGRFVDADKGTIFLDEAGTMEERTQVTLLRVLESGEFRPLGAKHDRSVDVRIISATNMDIDHAVEIGEFRADLHHRLQVLRIDVTPLRERLGDVPLLAKHFMEIANEELGFSIEGISADAMKVLKSYEWPGNIRELKHIIQQSVVMAEQGEIEVGHLPVRILNRMGSNDETHRAEKSSDMKNRSASSSSGAKQERSIETEDGVSIPLDYTLDDAQRTYVLEVLRKCENNKSKAARVLGISRKTLYDQLRRWESRI